MARFKHQGVFTDGSGVVVGAKTMSNGTDGVVQVTLAGSTTAATVYTNSTTATSANSVNTDDYGNFEFWVDTGDYSSTQAFKINLTHADVQNSTYDDIHVIPYGYEFTWGSTNGSAFEYIDQDVSTGAAPELVGTNFTSIPASGISSTDRTGVETMLVTASTGHTSRCFAAWSTGGDLIDSSFCSSDVDYALASANSTGTNVTAEELEELTDGSTTVLHRHGPDSIVEWTYGSQTSYSSTTTMTLSTGINSSSVTIEVLFNDLSINTDNTPAKIQVGNGSTYLATNYNMNTAGVSDAGTDEAFSTSAIQVGPAGYIDAALVTSGVIRLTRWDSSENIWQITGNANNGAHVLSVGGLLTASESVTSVRLITGSTASFDAGEARVRYQ